MNAVPDFAAIEAMDAADWLRPMRERFFLPPGLIYLDGNSLGVASTAAFDELRKAATEEWGQDLIRSWNTAGWFDMPLALGDRVGRPSRGAGRCRWLARSSPSCSRRAPGRSRGRWSGR